MEHRAVRRGAATEMVAPDHALESLAASGADDVHAIAVAEHRRHQDLIARVDGVAVCRDSDLAPDSGGRHASFLVVTRERLAGLRGTLLDETELHRFVAVALRVLR